MGSLKVIFLFTALIVLTGSCTTTGNTISSNFFAATSDSLPIADTISITAVGDVMLGSAYPLKPGLPEHDGLESFKHVNAFLKGDIIFGNLEGVLLDTGKSSKCKDTVNNSCFAFRMPERYGSILKKAGFNVLSIANNHIGDFEAAGRKRTAEILDSLEIKYAGQLPNPSVIFEKDSVRYAFCAFAPNENTMSVNQLDSAKKLVSALKAHADIVIVSFHGGAEGEKHEHVPQTDELFYKENRGNVYAFAHSVIDAGADVVLGHGPHVTRAVEVYKGRFIAYSLGNFCTYGSFNLSGPGGIAPLLQLKISSRGDFLYADIISVRQTKYNGLRPDSLHSAFKKIIALTNADFPGHRLSFSGTGHIAMKK